VPSTLAPVVEGLELRQPAVVTRAMLAGIASHADVELPANVLAERLVRLGWLLPLKTRDAWEFAPAARAGRFRSGDPWIELRALLEHNPNAPVAIAFESAVWELGHSSRQPAVPVLAHPRGRKVPRSLDARAVGFDWRLPTKEVRGLPVWTEATVLAAAAHRPAAQGDWANADEWLPETFASVAAEEVLVDGCDRGTATLARLGYLAEWAGRSDIADEIGRALPESLPVTFLGPRNQRRKWVNRWRVYDALLPSR
jgi:AbiEi antitoxin C-terminal domain